MPRWKRWLVITFVALSAYYSFLPGVFNDNSWFTLFGSLLFAGIIFSLLATQLYRYVRASTPLQRQQTKVGRLRSPCQLERSMVSDRDASKNYDTPMIACTRQDEPQLLLINRVHTEYLSSRKNRHRCPSPRVAINHIRPRHG